MSRSAEDILNKQWDVDLIAERFLLAKTDDGATTMRVYCNGNVAVPALTVSGIELIAVFPNPDDMIAMMQGATLMRGMIVFPDPDDVIAMLQDAKQLRGKEWPEAEAQEGSSDDGQSSP